jgi:glycerol-3-phosphate O-acyltransferase
MDLTKEKIRRTKRKKYQPIIPRKREWPVVQMSRNIKLFVETVIENTIDQIEADAPTTEALIDELEATLYLERLRIRQYPWAVDPKDDEAFWKKVKAKLVSISSEQYSEEQRQMIVDELVHSIVSRYAREISSTFKPTSYRMARTVVTFGFSRLLNAARVKGFRSLFSNRYTLRDKINIVGEHEHLRKLAQKGTIVMVPTHFSNLDSILIGWVIHELGLPAFIYGAGLNLFNIKIFAYFMNSLGAYKVDRRKKDKIYLETLKAYSSLALQWGCHSLFFPGGTRSRSGRVEDKLKLGLLGTAVEAQRIFFQQHVENEEPLEKIFVVPVVINYHFVLEAPTLIREYLEKEGQERYYTESDEYSTSYKILKFLIKFFTKGSDISVSFGRGMDFLGNPVDEEGNSLDKWGNPINTLEYFMMDGKITANAQREHEYTRMLAEAIRKDYYKNSRVFSSHLAAFTAFELFRKKYKKLDLFNLLRLPEEELVLSYAAFKNTFSLLREEVFRLQASGKVKTASHLQGDVDEVIAHGLENVGMYHAKRPLFQNKEGNITTMDMNTLFYYHNRMEGYDLEGFVK